MGKKCSNPVDYLREQFALSSEEYEEVRAEAQKFMSENAYNFKNSSFGHKFNV